MAQTGNPYSCVQRKATRKQPTCATPKEKARLSILAFVEEGAFVYNPATIIADILTAEQACKAIIIRETAAEYDGGAETMGATGGRQKERVVNRKHTISGIDYHYVGNEEAWMNLEANEKSYVLYGFTKSRMWPFGGDLSIRGKGAIANDPELDVEGQYTVIYDLLQKPVSIPVDVNGLDAIPFLPFVSLTNEAASAATLSAEEITVAAAASFDVKASFTGATSYELAPGSALPAGVTVQADGSITGAVAVAGTHEFAVRAENDCGVAGEVAIKLIVT